MNISDVLAAKTWRNLGLPKTKDSLRSLQRAFHPDQCSDPRAGDAFDKAMKLFDGPDYAIRTAIGTAVGSHSIEWKPVKGFEDLKANSLSALGKLSRLDVEYTRFFPKVAKSGLDSITIEYGDGWWFLADCGKLDSRTSVWVAKRAAAAIKKAHSVGLVHGDINPNTVVLLPSQHGLMLDGWWASVPDGERLKIKPDAGTPTRYFGGAPADENLMVAQLASMLTDCSDPDKLLAQTYKKFSLGTGNAKDFFEEVETVSKKLYGKPSWHPMANPTTTMI